MVVVVLAAAAVAAAAVVEVEHGHGLPQLTFQVLRAAEVLEGLANVPFDFVAVVASDLKKMSRDKLSN